MRRFDAIKVVMECLDEDDIAIFSTGMIGREAHHLGDRAANLYMVGSMGLASSLGLGIALNTEKRVFVFDGDGSVLMDMGTMAMIGFEKPGNLYHIVLDNASYQSTGGQPTISPETDLPSIAHAVGYAQVARVADAGELRARVKALKGTIGPVFLHMEVERAGLKNVSRVGLSPEGLARRTREALR